MDRTRTTRGIWALACALVLALAAPAAGAEWYAGDGHVHTCYSHDAWCPDEPLDSPFYDTPIYSSGGTVAQRFAEAAGKGLHFLVVSDHDTVAAQSDPDFGSAGVVGFPAYEGSLQGGHAHLLGATRLYDKGDGQPPATRALADTLRSDGGLFQANHPAYKASEPFTECAQAEPPLVENRLHWEYGYSVRPDTLEVWNATTLIQPSELYWECWLQRGNRIAGTAGSDSHGATQPTIANPTTWVLADSPAPEDIIAGLRAGRTTLSRQAPSQGGTRLLIEADRDGDGRFESGIGSQVPVGTPLQVRAEGMPGAGIVRVRANGRTVEDGARLAPGRANPLLWRPTEPGWVRATLYLNDGTRGIDPGCAPQGSIQAIDTCTADLAIAAMTSPIYVGPEQAAMPETAGGPIGGSHDTHSDGEDPPLAAGEQSNGYADLPVVPSQRAVGARVRALRVRVRSPRGREVVLRIAWSAPQRPVQVQVRRGSRWRTVRRAAFDRATTARLPARPRYAVRVRTRPANAVPGPWRVARARRR